MGRVLKRLLGRCRIVGQENFKRPEPFVTLVLRLPPVKLVAGGMDRLPTELGAGAFDQLGVLDRQLVRRPVERSGFPVLVAIKIPGCENIDPALEAFFLLPHALGELVPEVALAPAVRRRLKRPESVNRSRNRWQEIELEPPGVVPERDLRHVPDIELLAGTDTRFLVRLLVGDGGFELSKRQARVLDIVLDLGLEEGGKIVVPNFVALIDFADLGIVETRSDRPDVRIARKPVACNKP